MNLAKKEVERIVKDTFSYRLSFSYNSYDNVENINIIDNGKLEVEADVNVLGKYNHCKVLINLQGYVEKYQCDCKWCNEHSACGHIGAVLLKLEHLVVNKFPYTYHSDKQEKIRERNEKILAEKRRQQKLALLQEGRRFMEFHKQQYTKELKAAIDLSSYELVPEVNIEYNEDIILSFRIGKEKKYVLQDITHFIACIYQRQQHKYGKFLDFVHHMDAFDEDAKKQIEFIQRVIGYYEMKANQNIYYQKPSLKKYLPIQLEMFDDFYETFHTLDVVGMRFVDDEPLVDIYIEEDDDVYRISMKEDAYLLGEINRYYFENEDVAVCMHRQKFDEKGKMNHFIYQLQNYEMVISKEEYDDFYRYVLSDIQQYINIHGNALPSKLYEAYDKICLYADIDDESNIFVTLECYNEQGNRIHGLDEKSINSYKQDLIETFIKKYAQVIDYDKHIAYFDQNAEDTFIFLEQGLSYLNQYCEVFVSDALQKMNKKYSYTIHVGVKVKNNLLEIDIDSLDIPLVELSNVLQSYRKKRKFHRLKNGNILNLQSKELQQLDDLLMSQHMKIQDIETGHIKVPMYRMFSLDDGLEEATSLHVKREESFQQQLYNFKNKQQMSYEIPSAYQSILRDYQKEGYQWLSVLRNFGFHGILADDMGLGKTLQVICMLEGLQEQGTSIVVCPSSLVYNWIDEIQKFSKRLKACSVVGNAINRKSLIQTYKEYDVLITSYDYIRRDIDLYEDKQFLYVILDEAQYIKNQRTKNAISVKQLQSKYRLALTGTPIENSLAELWSIFDFLMPNYLFPYAYFQKQFETEIVKNHNVEKQEALKKLVSPFILRRNKQEVLKELPEKIEKTQYIEFEEEEQKVYLANLAKCNTQLQEMVQDEQTDKIAILAMLTRLRQLCCEPRLIYDNIDSPSSKMKACLELVETLRENNQKVLIFSGFTSVLDLLSFELAKRHISYYTLTGSTSKEERRELVQRFQNDDTDVFLISLKAGGTGLNLTAAQAVIHYDPWWNQSAQNQASDRAYRMGQKHNVQVFKLVMKNSIEEKIEKMQIRKKELANMFVENNEGSISTMSQQDLLDLFKIE